MGTGWRALVGSLTRQPAEAERGLGALARYRALTQYPQARSGAYADFVERNGFQFPGALGAGPDTVIYHDLTHVLSGYDTDAAGETQVAAFHAGARRKDPSRSSSSSCCQFHLGMRMTPSPRPNTASSIPEGPPCTAPGSSLQDRSHRWMGSLAGRGSTVGRSAPGYGIPPLPPEPRK